MSSTYKQDKWRASRMAIPIAWSLCFACSQEKETETEPVVPPPIQITPFTVDPAEGVIRRLTQSQYKNTIRDIFGPEIVIAGSLEPDFAVSGLLTVGASQSTISSWGVEQYERISYKLAEQILSNEGIRASLVPCTNSANFDEQCVKTFITDLGLLLWRRPVSNDELSELIALAENATNVLGDIDGGLAYPLASMLQSPNFLFRVELGRAEGTYNDFEMAQRLSFFLWNTTPDAKLLQAASDGLLSTDAGLEAQIDRMLVSEKAKEGVANFFIEWFELERLDDMVKDPNIFVHFNSELGDNAKEETLRVIEDHIFAQDADYRDLFTRTETYINRRLAALYEVRAPAKEGFAKFSFQRSHGRRGIIGHTSLLSLHSHAVASSATLRGKFIRQTLLCGVVPPPPVNVDTALPEPSGTAITLRQRINEHSQNPTCSFCHLMVDPIGLGLENFDGIGRFRTKEGGVTIDPSGTLDKVYFKDAWELAEVIRNHPQLPSCFVKNIYQYATGNVASKGELGQINALTQMFQNGQFKVKSLIKDIAMSEGFRKVKEASK